MLVRVSQEDVCFVRVLCVWRCIQTDLWGIELLESCHFYLFQLPLSAVCNCRLPIKLFTQKKDFFYLLHPPFPSRSFHHPRPIDKVKETVGCPICHFRLCKDAHERPLCKITLQKYQKAGGFQQQQHGDDLEGQ